MMMRIGLLLLIGVISGGLRAQPAPEQVDLDAVLVLARQHSPRLQLEQQAIAAAQADRLGATVHPNPVVSYSRQGRGVVPTGNGQNDLSVELPLLIGGRRQARIESADRGVALARARAGAAAHGVSAEVGSGFFALLSAQRRVQVLNEALAELERISAIVTHRQQTGLASQYDVLRMSIELASWRNRLTEAVSDQLDQQARLANLVGLPAWRPVAVGALEPFATEPRPASDPSRHPSLLAQSSDRAVAEANLELARRDRLPSVSISVGRGWGADLSSAIGSAGVSVEIPWLDRRIAPMDRAATELRSAALREEQTRAELSIERARQSVLVEQRAAALERFMTTVQPRLSGLKQMSEDAYRLGRGTLVELLDATRVRFETTLDQVTQVAALMEAQWRLKAAVGELTPSSGQR